MPYRIHFMNRILLILHAIRENISLPGMLQYIHILATDVQLGAVYLYEEADYLVPLIVLHLLLFCTVGPV